MLKTQEHEGDGDADEVERPHPEHARGYDERTHGGQRRREALQAAAVVVYSRSLFLSSFRRFL